jgi:AraC-like DNA-binding protein
MPVEVHLPSHPFLHRMLNHITFMDMVPNESPGEWMRIFPNGTTNLCITLYEDLMSKEYGSMRNNISTTCIRPVTFYSGRRLRMITIQFRPCAFHLFTGVPMKDFANEFPDHDTFFPASQLESLYDSLDSVDSIPRQLAIMEDFLIRNWRIRQEDPRMESLIKQIMADPGKNVDQLAASVNLSTRRLRDLFILQSSISPKYFSKLVRFNLALRTIVDQPKVPLTNIALDLGFYDQAHFIRNIREFGGISPSEFRKIKSSTSDYYNFQETETPIFSI